MQSAVLGVMGEAEEIEDCILAEEAEGDLEGIAAFPQLLAVGWWRLWGQWEGTQAQASQ